MGYAKEYLKLKKENFDEGALAFYSAMDSIGKVSKDIVNSILSELRDQREYLKMIASENYSSLAVQQAMATLLTDKYCEGIPNKRFYAGCDHVDFIEITAIEEAKKLFGSDHAYVQPHSGSDANLIAYFAILAQKIQSKEIEKFRKTKIEELTDDEYEKLRQVFVSQKLLGMALDSGGHLSHGYRQNISSKLFQAFSYRVDPKTHLIDYQEIRKKAKEIKPLILLAGYSAYPRKIDFAKMREIADEVGAVLMVDMAHFAGLVAGKVFKDVYDPIPYAHVVTSTTHKTLRGPRGGIILCKKEFKDAMDMGCPFVQGGPLPHVIAAKAVAFKEADTEKFRIYAANIVKNANILSEELKNLGASIITGGTDNHLLLIDVVKSFSLTGKQAESALREAQVIVNRNTIPYDQNRPWIASGIRVGTPALTSRGMGSQEMKIIAKIIMDVLKNTQSKKDETGKKSQSEFLFDEDACLVQRERVKDLAKKFPLYPELCLGDLVEKNFSKLQSKEEIARVRNGN